MKEMEEELALVHFLFLVALVLLQEVVERLKLHHLEVKDVLLRLGLHIAILVALLVFDFLVVDVDQIDYRLLCFAVIS